MYTVRLIEVDCMNDDYLEITKFFKAFADEKRLTILNLLKEGEKCACVLLQKIGTTQSVLSYHMKILMDAGLVIGRSEGKWVYYSIDTEALGKVQQTFQKLLP